MSISRISAYFGLYFRSSSVLIQLFIVLLRIEESSRSHSGRPCASFRLLPMCRAPDIHQERSGAKDRATVTPVALSDSDEIRNASQRPHRRTIDSPAAEHHDHNHTCRRIPTKRNKTMDNSPNKVNFFMGSTPLNVHLDHQSSIYHLSF